MGDILLRISTGFLIGAAVAVAIVNQWTEKQALSMAPLEILLTVYGLGSVFGLGYLATALLFEAEE